ncbi:MAG TPA: hypothetical protein PKW06_15105 [Cyclobacteriaceae bacterium]|nr:hypothetical protein [Cyclobacteriaceae bacterium]MCB9237207.1 hypothetical protein [Flammeovirgaceae bacterium]MCB0499975.1 hypothetical protein [Cyclobacteriaceae bacterium]MCO5270916.1 hypothetical protein [Cyclobacteriaceae bacterium]MCW5901798.1 hypothetical protein [Cyclobacteriaceae bacterium]
MKASWLLWCMLLLAGVASAQREIDERAGWGLKDRVYLGGGFGLNGGNDSFGNRYFYIGLNPIIGYMISPQFSGGLGLQWQHYSYPDVDAKIDQYGVSPFLRYNFGQLFAYTEYNVLNTPTLYNNERKNFDRFLMGLGYSQPLGRRGSLNAMALYDLIYSNTDRAFASPWVFRVYFSF